jgi:hypothetical protein
VSLTFAYPWPYHSLSALSSSSEVPSTYPVGLAGRPLVLDTVINRWRHTSIPLLRAQADQSSQPGSASLNPEALWRRFSESWHHGAGQEWADRQGSDVFRFNESKGVDVWDTYQLTLLNDTDQKVSSANSNLYLTTAGSRLYYSDDQTLKFTTDITPGAPSFTTVTGTAAVAINGVASDGFNIYIAQGASGIYKSDTGISTAASWVTGTVSGVIDYVKGRLVCSSGASIYNPTGAGALPGPHFTHPNSNFSWVGFAPGQGAIYAAGFSGDKSLIYKIGITQDSVTLEEPIVAGELPDGEIVYGIGGYLGFIMLGTSKGVRFCLTDQQDNLLVSAPIPAANPVRCFEGQDRFVWYGLTNYDTESTGLGRLDVSQFTETAETGALKPAYASDLMATGQGNVINVVTFQSIRVFSVAGLGVYGEDTPLVASGTMSSGKWCYGIPDDKTAISFDVRCMPLMGGFSAYIMVDDGAETLLGSEDTVGSGGAEFPVGYQVGECFEIILELDRDGSSTTDGPQISRYTLKSAPAAIDGPAEYIIAPFLLHDVIDINGVEFYQDTSFELENIKALRRSQQRVSYQEGPNTYDVFVNDYEYIPYAFTHAEGGGFGTPNGTCVTQLRRIN